MDAMTKGVFAEMTAEKAKENARKIEKAGELKESGNRKFKEGDFTGAIRDYNTVFLFINGLVGTSAAEGEQVKQMRLASELNLAAAHHKLGRNEKALKHSRNAVAIDPKNPKALFRRGRALLAKGDLDGAGEDLAAAMKLDPKSPEIRAELQVFQKKRAEHEKKDKKTFAAVFQRIEAEDAASAAASATATTTTTSASTTPTDPAPSSTSS